MSCVFEPITVRNSLHDFEKKDAYSFSIVPMRKYAGTIGGTYLDLGANHGWTAIHAINCGFDRVVAFEPNPESCERALANFKGCERITLVPKAVMAEAGVVYIENHRKSLNQKVRLSPRRGDEVAVDGVAFRDVMAEHRPAFVKFDIEGAEYEIIREWDPESFVNGIALEIHSATKPENFAVAKEFLLRCKDQGFQADSPRKYGMKNGLPRSYCSNFIMSRVPIHRNRRPDLSFYDQLGEVDS
jgi:FkbM family methyltransferase